MNQQITLDPNVQIQSLATQVAQKAVVVAQLEALVAHLQGELQNVHSASEYSPSSEDFA